MEGASGIKPENPEIRKILIKPWHIKKVKVK